VQSGLNYGSYQNAPLDDVSSISDELGMRDCFNACIHTRRSNFEGLPQPKSIDKTSEATAILAALAPSATTGWFCCKVDCIGGVRKITPKAFFNNSWPNYTLPAPAWLDMVQEVGQGLSGDMKSKSMILSSLVELGTTLRMVKNPMGLTNLIRMKSSTWRKLSVADCFKQGPARWLEYRYGWSPVLSDIKSILNVADQVTDHMKYLQESVGRLVPVRARRSYTVNVTPTTPTQLLFPAYYNASAQLTATSARVDREAAFGVCILRGPSFRIGSRAQYVKQRLGVESLLETSWDLIPLSFVVDWFFDVQSLLAYDPIAWWRYDLRRMGYSVKDTVTVDAEWQTVIGAYPPYFPLQRETSARQTVKGLISYTRVPGFPSGTSSTGLFGNLRLVNLADGAAIIAQRLL